jgi:indole-3-glycerol phosphate synthase
MTNILHEIISHKKEEVAALKAQIPLEVLQARADIHKVRRPFFELFERTGVLIGEIKPKSPSHGALTSDPLSIARQYAPTMIDCISVLTDARYFGGSLALLEQVHTLVPQTILRKEFIVDVYQIYETAQSCADAVLLIASVLEEADLVACIAACEVCNLGYFVEVHTELEVQKALRSGARVIGINNRNLDTLTIDLSVTEKLIAAVPHSVPVISESGIQNAADVSRVRKAGARGILVGASILQSAHPAEHIASLQAALVQ